MPYRFEGFFSLLACALASVFACLAAAVPDLSDAVGAASSLHGQILNDTQMRFGCVAGALGGAVLTVLIFPPRVATRRTIASKFVASGISGVIFAPLALRWLGFSRDFDSVLCVSAVVALTAIGILRIAVPAWERIAGKQLGDGGSREPASRDDDSFGSHT